MTQVLRGGVQPPRHDNDLSQNDLSASSLSDYTRTHTEDIRKMFAKTPAGQQEIRDREEEDDEENKQAIRTNAAYFNKKTTYVAVKNTNRPLGNED